MKFYFRTIIFYIVFLLLSFSVFSETKNEVEKIVRVGYVNVVGYEEGLEGEPKTGFGYEYLQKISYYTGWKYEYIYGSFSELISKLADGQIDLMGDVSITPERTKIMNFSSYSQGTEKFYLCSKENNEISAGNGLAAYSNKKIGATKNSFQEKLVKQWIAEHNLNSTVIGYNGSAALAKGLEANEVDYIVLTDTAETFGFYPVQFLGFHPYYFAVAKDRTDLLSELDAALSIIQGNKPNYNAIVESKYNNGTVGSSFLSKEEKRWLAEHNNTIKIGFLNNNLPYSSLDSNGNIQGYLSALIRTLKEKFNIEVESKSYSSIYDLRNDIETGKIDTYGPVYGTLYLSEINAVMQTDSIMETNLTIIYKGNNIKKEKLAVTNSVMMFDEAVKMKFSESEIILYDDISSCLKAVAKGHADATLMPSSMINTLRQYKYFSKLNYIDLNEVLNISMFTQKGIKEVYTIIEKAIILSDSELRSSSYMNYSYSKQKESLIEIIEDNSASLMIIIAFIAMIILLLYLKAIKSETKAKLSAQEAIKANEEIKKLVSSLESANNAKTVFLSNMSHDIRTPMNAVLGFSKLIRNEINNPDKIMDYLEKIESSGEYLLSIINNILEISKIDSGKAELDEAIIDVPKEVNTFIAMFQDDLSKKNQTLNVNIDIKNQYILADIVKIKQILINLLSNSIKYTPENGCINFEIKEKACDKTGYASFIITIEDNGIGMSKDFQQKIFESFTREKNTTHSKIIGTGLGMAIVKKIIDLMHGTIEVESESGKGTKFTVNLSGKIVETPEKASLQKQKNSISDTIDLSEKRILLTEDNELNAEIATVILENMGFIIEHAADGVICLSMIEEAPENYYDLVLMDIQMPNMNGYQTTKRIRSLNNKIKSKIPIVAMTANAFDEDKKMALEVGMNGHLQKPIDEDSLRQVISQIFESATN